jgi:hypothetical protein
VNLQDIEREVEFFGLTVSQILTFKKHIELADISDVMDECKKILREKIRLEKENKVLKFKLSVYEEQQ